MARFPVKARQREPSEALRDLISAGDAPAVAARFEKGATAEGLVHHAVLGGVKEILSLVLENGGDANERNSAGETPIMTATRHGRPDLMDALLKYGADPCASSNSGAMAIDEAEPWPYLEELLEQAMERHKLAPPKIVQRGPRELARKLSS